MIKLSRKFDDFYFLGQMKLKEYFDNLRNLKTRISFTNKIIFTLNYFIIRVVRLFRQVGLRIKAKELHIRCAYIDLISTFSKRFYKAIKEENFSKVGYCRIKWTKHRIKWSFCKTKRKLQKRVLSKKKFLYIIKQNEV